MKFPTDLSSLLEKAQEMQQSMAQIQVDLEQKTVEASSGGGMVTAKVNGGLKLVGVTIDPIVVNPNDIEMLQDLVTAAVNEGLRKAKDMAKEEMSKLTGGISIPGL